MNYGIKIKNQFLDFFPGAVISFQNNNRIFAGTSADILPGSFQVPQAVRLSDKNKKLLNNPHLVNNADSLMRDEPAEIYLGGNIVWKGLLSVKGANEFTARIQTVINPLKKLKTIKLRELDLGGVRNIGADSAAARAHAKDTIINPNNYDYHFFPVQNGDFIVEKAATGGNARFWQNYWDTNTQEFVENSDAPVAMPFVRVDYLLERIFENTGFAFVNRWQTDFELKRLVIYNNYSIYKDDGTWGTEINLINHVPDILASEFLKVFMSNFALGLFVDFNNFKIELIPLRDLISSPAKHDWTDKLIRGLETSQNKFNAPDAYRYEEQSNDRFYTDVLSDVRPNDATSVVGYDNLPPPSQSPGNYYIENLNMYIFWENFGQAGIGGGATNLHLDTGVAPAYNTDTEFLVKGAPLMQVNMGYAPFSLKYTGVLGLNLDVMRHFPIILTQGTIPFIEGNEKADMPLRYTIYRGLALAQDSLQYPYASAFPYESRDIKIGNYSLYWNGEDGIYEKWYRRWHEMLLYGKPVKATFKLTVSDYLKFSQKDKIRIKGMEYFVISDKPSFNSKGLRQVECELISVI